MVLSNKTRDSCSKNRHQSGFTLVELLVALALLGLISLVMFGGLRFGVRTWERTDQTNTLIDEERAARSFLRTLISRTYPKRDPSYVGRQAVKFEGAGATLSFFAQAPEAMGSEKFMWFTLSSQPGEYGSALQLAWSPDPEISISGQSTSGKKVLLKGLDKIEFGYFGSVQPKTPPSWHSVWKAQRALPKLVRVRLRRSVETRQTLPDLIVSPRITMDNNCVYDPVSRNCRGR